MKADDVGRARHLSEQLLEDAGARISRRLDRRAGADRGEARDGQAGRRPVHRRSRSAHRLRGGAARHPRPAAAGAARATTRHEARRHGGGAATGARAADSRGRRRAAGSSSGRRCPTRSTPIALLDRAVRARRHLRGRARRSSSTASGRNLHAAVVLGADARSDPRGRARGSAAAVREELAAAHPFGAGGSTGTMIPGSAVSGTSGIVGQGRLDQQRSMHSASRPPVTRPRRSHPRTRGGERRRHERILVAASS